MPYIRVRKSVWILCWTRLFRTIKLCFETRGIVQFEFSTCLLKHESWPINTEYIKIQGFSNSSLIETLLYNFDENSTWTICADKITDLSQCKIAFYELTYNSHNKTNKRTDVKIIFLHTIFYNSTCFSLSLTCSGSYLILVKHIRKHGWLIKCNKICLFIICLQIL